MVVREDAWLTTGAAAARALAFGGRRAVDVTGVPPRADRPGGGAGGLNRGPVPIVPSAAGLRRGPALLESAAFDVVVVGGGVTGACIAHDAALRGLTVALVEQRDFGGATSAASSKLLHGGIRHLQRLRIDKVRESLRERAHFRRIAPHLSHWVPFLIPTYRTWRRGRWFLGRGLALYARLGGGDEAVEPASGTWLDRAELERVAPLVAEGEGVTGALVLNERHLRSSERMTLAFVKTAAAHGAVVANYVAAEGLLREGSRVVGVCARDVERGGEFPIRARVTVNAAGPWLPALNERFAAGKLRRPVTGLAVGAHVVTRRIMDRFAVALSTRRRSAALVGRGGRHVFVIPWRGHSLIGTSNRPFAGDPAAVRPTPEDVSDLVEDVNRALPSAALSAGDVRHAFAGLYPLTAASVKPGVYQGAADYQVVDHERLGGAPGVVSALGAKYTTARRLAELATTVVCRKLNRRGERCRTAETPLVGADASDPAGLRRRVAALSGDRLGSETVDALVRHYGVEALRVVECAAEDPARLERVAAGRETIAAEVVFAVEHEMARRLDDVVFRRTGLGTLGHPGADCLERCARIMAGRLGWSEEHRRRQVERTRAAFPVAPA